MIVFSATMWPDGNQAGSYEVLSGTVTNQTAMGNVPQSYFAHVLARPKQYEGILGYEADIEVTGHNYRDGFAPLLAAILNAAHVNDQTQGMLLPPARQLARLEVVDAFQFEEILRKGPV